MRSQLVLTDTIRVGLIMNAMQGKEKTSNRVTSASLGELDTDTCISVQRLTLVRTRVRVLTYIMYSTQVIESELLVQYTCPYG